MLRVTLLEYNRLEFRVDSDENKISEALYYDVEGNVHLDMQTANEIHLVRNGVKLENIYKTKLCTSCSDNFFSHLRDNGNTGRMMGYIGWNQG